MYDVHEPCKHDHDHVLSPYYIAVMYPVYHVQVLNLCLVHITTTVLEQLYPGVPEVHHTNQPILSHADATGPVKLSWAGPFSTKFAQKYSRGGKHLKFTELKT